MRVDIEQWHAEIGSFNRHFLGVIMKLELNLLNIISSLNQVLALIFALLFQHISNMDNAFCFSKIFFVFALLTVVLKFSVLESLSLSVNIYTIRFQFFVV